MSDDALIQQLRQGRGPQAASLEEYFAAAKQSAWNELRNLARRAPGAVSDEVIDWTSKRLDEAPGSFFALLLDVAAKDPERRGRLIERFRREFPRHPKEALDAAGYNLHEYHDLLDRGFVDLALAHHDASPEGAWGILESTSMYEAQLLSPADLEAFHARRGGWPRDYAVCLLSLAKRWPERAAQLLERVVAEFPAHPAEAVEAAAFAARDEAALLTPELVAALRRHFDAKPEKAWEFFEGAARAAPERFDDVLLDALTAKAEREPGTLFAILRRLLDERPALWPRYIALLRRHPEPGISAVRYGFQGEDVNLLRRDLVEALGDGFAANAYPAYDVFTTLARRRPELIGPREVEAAIRNIPHATNYAFGFFQELLKLRPEFTRDCTLALFECLAQEPVNRAFVRAEEMGAIIAISEAAHIKTGLEKALREPPRVGSRRARALMAIMFRQTLRARRHVLLEALRYASGLVLFRDVPGGESEKYSPVWDFLMFIIDHAGDDAISTASAERYLEGAFQLHYLCRTGAEQSDFLRKFDLGYPPAAPWPAGLEFLAADAELTLLWNRVAALGRRFEVPPKLGPVEKFLGRFEAARRELEAVEAKGATSDGTRKRRLGERRKSLAFLAACGEDPAYRKAFTDPAAEAALAEPARALLRREKKDVAKHLRDALNAEAIRIAVAAVDRLRLELYRNRLRDVLGREVDLDRVEPKILPSFLWFQAIGNLPANRKYLRRLIEDRMEGRPHEWLRTEPAALEWAERVRKETPGVRLERWRAPFTKEYAYRPKDALAEKKRRMKADLAQARTLLEKAGAEGLKAETYDALAEALAERRAEQDPKKKADPALLEEVGLNLERVRIAEQTPDSDFEGKIVLSVESDPFEILFMGEYGFASCLSLRGSNAWSAVSNAIDVDKTVVWAREPGGNVVGRRLLALLPEGVAAFRTYVNRHGLALDAWMDAFVGEYAAYCGTRVIHGGRPAPLLSDRWYDDGAL